jgi:hypothetical protein
MRGIFCILLQQIPRIPITLFSHTIALFLFGNAKVDS